MKKHQLILLVAGFLAFASLQACTASLAFAEEKSDSKGGEGEGGKKKGDTDVTGGRFVGDPIYVHIAPMVLPVINDKGVEQLVTIIFDVQVKDFDAADALHANMPRVVDSLMRNLYGGLGQGSLSNGKLINVNKLKNKAVSAIGEVIGADKVSDVLVQGVAQRML